MTDREMAIALGEYITRLRRRIEILKAILIERGIVAPGKVPWEELAKLIPDEEEEIQRLFSSQLDELRKELSDQTPASEVIRILHRSFVER